VSRLVAACSGRMARSGRRKAARALCHLPFLANLFAPAPFGLELSMVAACLRVVVGLGRRGGTERAWAGARRWALAALRLQCSSASRGHWLAGYIRALLVDRHGGIERRWMAAWAAHLLPVGHVEAAEWIRPRRLHRPDPSSAAWTPKKNWWRRAANAAPCSPTWMSATYPSDGTNERLRRG